MKPMTTESDSNVICFPSPGHNLDPFPWLKMIIVSRYAGARLLNKLHTGQISALTEQDKSDLRFVNEHCKMLGITPLKGDF